MLACYQQAGSDGKYVGVSGKWVRWFTLTLLNGGLLNWPVYDTLSLKEEVEKGGYHSL